MQLKKSARRLLKDKPSGSNEEREDPGNIDDGEAINSIKDATAFKVEKIGDSTPVQDFESMMLRRDGAEWVNKAITNMKTIILQLITDSFEGDNFQKVLDCLIALRKGCILEQVSLLLYLLLDLSRIIAKYAVLFSWYITIKSYYISSIYIFVF